MTRGCDARDGEERRQALLLGSYLLGLPRQGMKSNFFRSNVIALLTL